MNVLLNRLYADYLMPSRLPVYEDFLRAARDAGYAQIAVREYLQRLRRNGGKAGQGTVVHRHDIDTDLRTARKLFEIEKKYEVRSTFYFRLSTLDFPLMRAIEAYGSEASYHYEELASFAKKHGIKDRGIILGRLPEIRADFERNFRSVQEQCGHKLTTVASHGDFANRRLKLTNTEILRDQSLRARCGIECESYDRALLDHIDVYIADRPHPQYFHPASPFAALGKYRRICFLTHPRQWETNWMENTRDNAFRLYEGLSW